jgi:uncharacterized protein YecE (DUF72 family)
MPRPGALRVGTSGFHYVWWRGRFYPPSLPTESWFDYYAGFFDTVEINNSFYRLPEASTFRAWRERAPRGFVHAVKFSKFGSHNKKLLDPEATIGLFLERATELREHLGPILVQLPPNWRADVGRLDAFLAAAPRTHRWAIELRDPSWIGARTWRVLERHGAALCLHDRIEGQPWRTTTDWTYLRYHGPAGERGRYTSTFLRNETRRVRRELERGHDVYAYFNNDFNAYAIENALELRELLTGRDRRDSAGVRPPAMAR